VSAQFTLGDGEITVSRWYGGQNTGMLWSITDRYGNGADNLSREDLGELAEWLVSELVALHPEE
jgi:hypothetical protein